MKNKLLNLTKKIGSYVPFVNVYNSIKDTNYAAKGFGLKSSFEIFGVLFKNYCVS